MKLFDIRVFALLVLLASTSFGQSRSISLEEFDSVELVANTFLSENPYTENTEIQLFKKKSTKVESSRKVFCKYLSVEHSHCKWEYTEDGKTTFNEEILHGNAMSRRTEDGSWITSRAIRIGHLFKRQKNYATDKYFFVGEAEIDGMKCRVFSKESVKLIPRNKNEFRKLRLKTERSGSVLKAITCERKFAGHIRETVTFIQTLPLPIRKT
ncbi:MAG: hypothetical protein IPJ55_09240 [Chloracidobacterium sp.]|nr:hypothetical protein [Chloracidobacterium sp.]